MFKLSKLADYGTVLLAAWVVPRAEETYTSRQLAQISRLPLPTVSKVLKSLCRAGLLASRRGVGGGYGLARPAAAISVLDIIAAIEGPLAMTECSSAAPGLCHLEAACPVRSNWQRLNGVVMAALAGLSLVDLQRPVAVPHLKSRKAVS